jgi:hypothetical protein
VPFRQKNADDFLAQSRPAICNGALKEFDGVRAKPEYALEARFAAHLRDPRNVTIRARRYDVRRNANAGTMRKRLKRSVQTDI